MRTRIVFLLFCLLLAACGEETAVSTPITDPTATTAPSETAVPPPGELPVISEIAPTATQTATPVPTRTPTATPPPTAAAEDVAYSIFTDAAAGYRLATPDAWFSSERPFQFFTSTEDFIDGVNGPERGAMVAVIPLSAIAYVNQPLPDILQNVLNSFPIAAVMEQVAPPIPLQINDQSAITTIQQGVNERGSDITAVYTVVQQDEQLALLLTIISSADFAEYAPVTTAMQSSFTFIEPTTAAPQIQLETFVSEDGRFAFVHPANWVTAPAQNPILNAPLAFTTATSADLLDHDGWAQTGSAMQIALLPAETLVQADAAPSAALAQLLDALSLTAGTVTTATLSGLPAAQTRLTLTADDVETAVHVTAIPAGDHILIAVGSTPLTTATAYLPALDAIAASLLWTEASYGGFVTYTHPERPLTFRYPSAWAVNDADVDGLILASNEEALAANRFDAGGFLFVFSDTFETAQTPENIVALFRENLGMTQNSDASTPIETMTINAQPAAAATYRSPFAGLDLQTTITAVAVENSVTAMVGVASVGETAVYNPIFTVMARSIQMTP